MNHHPLLHRMTREQLISRLESELEGVARMRLARRLAPEYMRHYGIFPNGVDLIPWLTRTRCRTNAEAMVHWIEMQFDDPSFVEAEQEAEKSIVLAHRLQRLLSSVEASHPW
jgi:hypothetical protein